MAVVSRKSEVKIYLEKCLAAYHNQGVGACVGALEKEILSRRVKFPLLEFCGHILFETLKPKEHLPLCDQIEALKTEGGNVLLGIILQRRLDIDFKEALAKTTKYISLADIWYVCDIIGERVYGYALLHAPGKTIPAIKQLSKHPSQWVVRSLGAGTHYAIKKGLAKTNVKKMFALLLSIANTKNKEIKQGVGWAAKTTAKFHPEIITSFKAQIEDEEKVANWFRKKVAIGLNRNQYAQRN